MSKLEEVEVPVRTTNPGTYSYSKYMRDGSVRKITAVKREPKRGRKKAQANVGTKFDDIA